MSILNRALVLALLLLASGCAATSLPQRSEPSATSARRAVLFDGYELGAARRETDASHVAAPLRELGTDRPRVVAVVRGPVRIRNSDCPLCRSDVR